jgi:hypothetical protein
MKFQDTVAYRCRYGDNAEKIWGEWNILWEDSEADYQGHASILAEREGRYCFYEWWYGSCSGCDTWESAGLSDFDIEDEMRKTAMWFDSQEELKTWLEMLEGRTPISNYGTGGLVGGIDILSGGLLGRVNAIRQTLGMPPYEPPKEDVSNVETPSRKRKKKGAKYVDVIDDLDV